MDAFKNISMDVRELISISENFTVRSFEARLSPMTKQRSTPLYDTAFGPHENDYPPAEESRATGSFFVQR